MFRYERPQKGRFRQFYQIGVEILGVEKAQADVEIMALANQILKNINLTGNIALHLNTIGDLESRAFYRDKLVAYLNTRKSELSKDSLDRLERNPLRILDSKDESDKRVVAEAPKLENSLNDTSRAFFNEIQNGLTKLGISYIIDPLLVRGLDYYCHSVFEFTTDALGSQNAVCSGGRYDNLISDLGGPKTAGVGWGAGMDRLTMMMADPPRSEKTVAIVPLGLDAEGPSLKLAQDLREAGIRVDVGYTGNLAKRMKRADKVGANFAVILGSDELAKGVAQVKNLATGEQREVALAQLTSHFS
jgi:histidyl-tRNA synthetase